MKFKRISRNEAALAVRLGVNPLYYRRAGMLHTYLGMPAVGSIVEWYAFEMRRVVTEHDDTDLVVCWLRGQQRQQMWTPARKYLFFVEEE